MADRYLTDADMTAIRADFGTLYETVRDLMEEPTLTLRRRSTTTEAYTTVGTFMPYSIDLLNRAEQQTGTNAGAVRESVMGRMLVDGSLTIRDTDRFTWSGANCVVTLVSPDTNIAGLRSVEFTVSGIVEVS